MTVTDGSREQLLETYGRWYGAERFAVAFTSTTEGDDAKRVTTTGWDKTAPLAEQYAPAHDLLLEPGSALRDSHRHCEKVQDPYCLRCQPQVMGACLDQMAHAWEILLTEANGVSDNPLVFADAMEALSGGNFHAEPVAFAADNLALAIAEIGALSERRTAMLMDPVLSNLPAFLVEHGGLNSGFMIAQVTAAALVAENRHLATPASTDSIPTSANQEDHVSMATHGARRLLAMTENLAAIVAIELIAAAQGIEFHRPARTSTVLEDCHARIRARVPAYENDRAHAPDIRAVQQMILAGEFADIAPGVLGH